MSDAISIAIGNSEFRNWLSYEVENDLLTPCDAFSFQVGSLSPELLVKAYPGQAVTVKFGDDVLLVGRLDEANVQYSGRDVSFQVLGRDQAAALVDCSTDRKWNYRSMSLAAVADKALRYLGISASVSASTAAQETLSKLKANPGESVWEFLDRFARRQEVLMWFRPDGTFELSSPESDSPAQFQLLHYLDPTKRNRNNVLEASISWNVAKRYSQITVLGQEEGFEGESSQPSAKRVDGELEELGLFRPFVLVDSDATTVKMADRRARWEIDRRRAEGLVLTYTVAGHRQDGRLIVPNVVAEVVDERVGISAEYLISAVRYTRSVSEGPRTRITLRRKGALLGLPDPVKPTQELF